MQEGIAVPIVLNLQLQKNLLPQVLYFDCSVKKLPNRHFKSIKKDHSVVQDNIRLNWKILPYLSRVKKWEAFSMCALSSLETLKNNKLL